MRKSAVILILVTFLCQNIAWGREFMLRPPLQGSLSKRTREVFNIPGFLLTGKIKLTKRQRAVLDLLAKGCKEGDIATKFSITKETVGSHSYSMREKLNLKGVGSRARSVSLSYLSK